MKLGAKDEGRPGLRWGTFYAAYFRDLDGNKLNVFHFPRLIDIRSAAAVSTLPR